MATETDLSVVTIGIPISVEDFNQEKTKQTTTGVKSINCAGIKVNSAQLEIAVQSAFGAAQFIDFTPG